MIKIYVSPSCSSCRKVKKWFKEQNIPFVEKNIFNSLNENELREMLNKSLNGTDDIISTRSKIIKENNIDIDSMSLSEFVKFVKENPSVLKRPIMVDDHRLQTGYNEEEIRAFIPRARRIAEMACNRKDCSKYDSCPSKLGEDESKC